MGEPSSHDDGVKADTDSQVNPKIPDAEDFGEQDGAQPSRTGAHGQHKNADGAEESHASAPTSRPTSPANLPATNPGPPAASNSSTLHSSGSTRGLRRAPTNPQGARAQRSRRTKEVVEHFLGTTLASAVQVVDRVKGGGRDQEGSEGQEGSKGKKRGKGKKRSRRQRDWARGFAKERSSGVIH